jgi:hypothetical protein
MPQVDSQAPLKGLKDLGMQPAPVVGDGKGQEKTGSKRLK